MLFLWFPFFTICVFPYSNTKSRISLLQEKLEDSQQQRAQLETKCKQITEQATAIHAQLEQETKLKQEKLDTIASLTVTLNESKSELEQLRRSFNDLKARNANEVNSLQHDISRKQSEFDQKLEELTNVRHQAERKFKQTISQLEQSVFKYEQECSNLKSELETKTCEWDSIKNQYEIKLQLARNERDSLETNHASFRTEMNNKNSDLERRISDLAERYEASQEEVDQTRSLLNQTENELKLKQSELTVLAEKYGRIELDRAALLAELDNHKRLLQVEVMEKKERMRTIQHLNDSLIASQSEVDK